MRLPLFHLFISLSFAPLALAARISETEELSSPAIVKPSISQPTSYERYAKRSKALSLAEAEQVFDEFRHNIKKCPNCRGGPLQLATGGQAFSLAELGGEETGTGLPARLGRAVLAAMVPQPAIGACLTMTLDLTAFGIPGVSLTLSIKGEVQYSVCSECFSWTVESAFLFEYGFEALGVGLQIGFDVQGRVDIKELPCVDAPEARYCRFLHLFVPPESRLLGSGNSKCHSDRPMEAFASFVNYQWNRLRATATGQRHYFANEFDQRLNRYRVDMQAYPYIFQRHSHIVQASIDGHGRVNNGQSRPRTLIVTCVKARGLLTPADGRLNPFCQLEVKLNERNQRHSYHDNWGGRGARNDQGCHYNSATQTCSELDRCVYKGGRTDSSCIFAPDFYGQIWRTSWIADSTSPTWNESHGFPLRDGGNRVTLGVQIWNFNAQNHAENVAKGNTVVDVHEGGVVEVDVQLQGGAGSATVWLHWLDAELVDAEETGLLGGPLDAFSAALAGFVGKLPRYSSQLGGRFVLHEDVERGIEYNNRNFRGRYLARWLRADNRAQVEQTEVEAFARDQDCGAEEDPAAPTDHSGCTWSSSTSMCEPADYCELEERSSWFSRRGCQLKEFVRVEACHSDLYTTHCCAADGETCSNPSQQVCNLEPASASTEPVMECHGGAGGSCSCVAGRCYDPVLGTCAAPRGDCRRGNAEQRRACCRDATSRTLIGRNAGGSEVEAAGWFSSWTAESHGFPCSSLESNSDERVANFALAMRNPRQETNVDRDEFFAEVATSAANLFVRTVADVQAMFNIYFANDPDWDDDCYTLRPSFQLFHEFEDEEHQQNLGIQPARSDQFITHRVDNEGTVENKGREIRDDRNPWCAYSWASGSTKPWHRAEFAKKDPPRGRDGYGHASDARHLNGTMMPQLWCELASALRNSPEGGAQPFGETRFRRGWSVSFQAACSQLKLLTPSNGNLSSASLHLWRRYDCEHTVLGSAFLTLFPHFSTRVRDVRARLGETLEDVLQCAGRMTDVARQFPTSTHYVSESCSVTSSEIAQRQSTHLDFKSRAENDARSLFIKTKTEEAIQLVKDWVAELSTIDRRFRKDFLRAFEFGERLTGLAFTAGSSTADGTTAIQRVRALYATAEALEERQSLLEEHLVEKAWQQRGQQNRALFPPPASYTTTLKTGIHMLDSRLDICAIQPQMGLTVQPFLTQLQGRTDQLVEGATGRMGNSRSCASGTFAPFSRLRVGITNCNRQVDVDGALQQEMAWVVSLESVLSVVDPIGTEPQHISEAFSQVPDTQAGAAAIREDRPMLSAAWAMARALLTSPGEILNTAGMSEMGAIIRGVAANLQAHASRLMSEVGNRLWNALTEAVSVRNYRLLDIRVHLVKIGNESYTPTFHAVYKTANVGKADAAFFGSPASLSAQVHLTWAFDLSEILAIAYHAIQHTQSHKDFSACAQCLSSPGMVFCDRDGAVSCVRGVSRCWGRSILTVFDCNAVGSDDEAEL